MYAEYFGLKEIPFSIAPDPAYLFLSERHREALAHLTFGLSETGGFVLLTGEVGTGKTTVSRCLLEQLPDNTQIAFILNPALNAIELMASICDELHIQYDATQQSMKVLFDSIRDHVLKKHQQGINTVLLIDEAQHLRPEVLEQLRLLTNLETDKRKLLKVILIGQPELQQLLRQQQLRQLAQRITARYHLLPLTRDEMVAYVQHRLHIAGSQRPIFTRKALNKLHQLSGGIPRLANLLCDRAMLAAYSKQVWQVDHQLIRAAAREVDGLIEAQPQPNPVWRWLSGAAIAANVVLCSWYGINQIQTEPEPPIVAAASPQWQDQLALSRQMPSAFHHLGELWGIAESGFGCGSSAQWQLQCYWHQNNLMSLLTLDRPAVMRLLDPQGQPFYATLLRSTAAGYEIGIGNERYQVSGQWLQQRWGGEAVLLWQTPPGYRGEISAQSQGDEVQWLETQLSFLQGHAPRNVRRFDSQLASRLRWFQQQAQLKPDAIAGARTLIKLNSALQTAGPRLQGAS